ncbi:unnamed protein product [Peniophora sp. CBMAI 1063]|nr:unnamed protein product [Peniophora sp. CBMAI 1063]
MREANPPHARRASDIHVDIARKAIFERNGTFATPEQVWTSLRHKNSSRKIHDFLFVCTHNAYHVGSYWANIPNLSHLGVCQSCDTTDSLDHILCECSSPGQSLVWRLARDLLSSKIADVPQATLGNIIGTHLLRIWAKPGFSDKGAERLSHIVFGESAQLIWAMRCRRVIDELYDYSDNEIAATGRVRITRRLLLDQAMSHPKYRPVALKRATVLATWSSILVNERLLPNDWIRYNGSLVSIRFPELRQPRRRPQR